MKISVICEQNYSNNFIFSTDDIEILSKNMLDFAINNNFSTEYPADYDYSFDVFICDNDFIHNINREYRKIDKPTDVITFALYADSENKIITENNISLGQIVISADKVKSQAKDNNVSEEYEFLNLLSHGILHLLGFDHPNDKLLENMLELQNRMIASVNYVKI